MKYCDAYRIVCVMWTVNFLFVPCAAAVYNYWIFSLSDDFCTWLWMLAFLTSVYMKVGMDIFAAYVILFSIGCHTISDC